MERGCGRTSQRKAPANAFSNLIKNLTADGYYTSYTGLVEELKYSGNTVLDHFPAVHDSGTLKRVIPKYP